MMPTNQKCILRVLNMSPIASSQDCGSNKIYYCYYTSNSTHGNLKIMAKGAKTTKETMTKKLLQDHREAQAFERKKAMHHREKSLKNP